MLVLLLELPRWPIIWVLLRASTQAVWTSLLPGGVFVASPPGLFPVGASVPGLSESKVDAPETRFFGDVVDVAKELVVWRLAI